MPPLLSELRSKNECGRKTDTRFLQMDDNTLQHGVQILPHSSL